jgi:hypothetical protein
MPARPRPRGVTAAYWPEQAPPTARWQILQLSHDKDITPRRFIAPPSTGRTPHRASRPPARGDPARRRAKHGRKRCRPSGRRACGRLRRVAGRRGPGSPDHVLGRQRGAELRFGEREPGVGDAKQLRRLGIDALRLPIGDLARLERMAAAEIDELGSEVVADPEPHVGDALQRVGKLGRGRVIGVDLGERACRRTRSPSSAGRTPRRDRPPP